MTCGFCSTGCGLNIHLDHGEAVELYAGYRLPREPGDGLPQGLGSPHRPPGRRPGDHAAVAARAGRRRLESGRLGHRACTGIPGTSSRRCTGATRAGVGRIPPAPGRSPPRRSAAFWATLPSSAWGSSTATAATRQCMAATCRRSLQRSFGFDARPIRIRTSRSQGRHRPGGREPLRGPSDHVGAGLPQPASAPDRIVCRARGGPGTGDGGHTAHLAVRPKSDLTLLYGVARRLIREGWIDREFIAAHTEGFEAFEEHDINFKPRRISCSSPGSASGNSARARPDHPRRASEVSVLVDHGRVARATRSRSHRHRRHPRRKDQGALGDRHQPGPFLDRSERSGDDPRSARLPRRAGHVPLDGDRAARRPGPARGGMGREKGRDLLGINSERRIGLIKKVSRAPGTGSLAAISPSSSSSPITGAVARRVPRLDRPRGRVPDPQKKRTSRRASHATSPESKRLPSG